MNQYKILDGNIREVEQKVAEHLAAGWKVAGGISVSMVVMPDPRTDQGASLVVTFAQAVVK